MHVMPDLTRDGVDPSEVAGASELRPRQVFCTRIA